jgi:ABC-type polysaccharide/polyol phosphate transport system ATPase subunit
VDVEFPVFLGHARSLRRSVFGLTEGGRIGTYKRDRVLVAALRNVSFAAAHGERIGLIGRNGAGKSTLLRVLARVYEPIRGRVDVHGRVASLIDLTLGMDPDATGEEVIQLRGKLLGLQRDELDQLVADVGEMTELGDFLRMPIRTYSTGMMMRLGFAVSTSVDADVVLMDEWIGAGDAAFLRKAEHRLTSFLGRTGVLVIASHSEAVLRDVCTRVIWLEGGAVRADGPAADVLAMYRES